MLRRFFYPKARLTSKCEGRKLLAKSFCVASLHPPTHFPCHFSHFCLLSQSPNNCVMQKEKKGISHAAAAAVKTEDGGVEISPDGTN